MPKTKPEADDNEPSSQQSEVWPAPAEVRREGGVLVTDVLVPEAKVRPSPRPPGPRPRWRSGWARMAAVCVIAGVAGLLSAWLMPRGPITGTGVVASVFGSAAAGFVAGLLLRSRWAMLMAPVAFTVLMELGRISAVGPSVDRPRLTMSLGVIVFVLGRVFGALVQVLPMVVGAAFGAGLGRRLDRVPVRAGWHRWPRYGRRTVAAITGLALVAATVLFTRPGSTAPILGQDRRPLAGSVAELATVSLGGHDQKVLIRGRDVRNPVLLYLAGGPGQSDLGYTRAYLSDLENDFVFAVWDQRGTGTSYPALDPTRSWTLQQAVADTVALTTYLQKRFGGQKAYLVGNSWGSILGVLAAQSRPDLYAAYIGAGQMVSVRESDQIIYRDVLAYAARTHDSTLAKRMRAWGPPPYRDIYANAFLIEYYDKIGPYPKTQFFETNGPGGVDGNGAREYGPLDKVNKLKGLFDMGRVMYPQLQQVDFRRSVPSLQVPVYLVQGSHELRARLDPARQWFASLQAPHKQWITFEDSGHIPQFEEATRFRDVLTGTVVAQTRGGSAQTTASSR